MKRQKFYPGDSPQPRSPNDTRTVAELRAHDWRAHAIAEGVLRNSRAHAVSCRREITRATTEDDAIRIEQIDDIGKRYRDALRPSFDRNTRFIVARARRDFNLSQRKRA